MTLLYINIDNMYSYLKSTYFPKPKKKKKKKIIGRLTLSYTFANLF